MWTMNIVSIKNFEVGSSLLVGEILHNKFLKYPTVLCFHIITNEVSYVNVNT